MTVDWLEERSTNCGNNITYLLDELVAHQVACDSIILIQDATMQRRMAAVLAKYRPAWTIINYAAYQVAVNEAGTKLAYDHQPVGMWPMQHYLSLLLGEIPRLRDDLAGYGPRGKDYLAHVTIPPAVEQAFATVVSRYPHLVRAANPAFASK